MPTHRQIRTAIAANIVSAQPNTKVHLFERYLREQGQLKTLYVDDTTSTLIGCHVRRIGTGRFALGTGRWMVKHKWQIRFFQALDDERETELLFDDWIEAVAEVFRLDETLGGLVFETRPEEGAEIAGLQVDDSGHVTFCGVLSHAAKCTLFTTHLE